MNPVGKIRVSNLSIRSARPLPGEAEGEDIVWSLWKHRVATMASEMMEFTKNNILTQAAQAMLAQANQQPQGVLQLLR
jgi:hypothetical protein